MNKSDKLLVTTIIILTLLVAASSFYFSEANQICFNEHCYFVEIADSPAERTQGLMFKESLSEKNGMLFIFEYEGIYPFHMKNTLIPLDMIWINSSKEIVYIEENARPCAETCDPIMPRAKALYVVELNAGTSALIGLAPGDPVRFQLA
ncbi:MAG: DUF192 domain-containing protein [archaeon]